jgi:hypothetical protein
MALVEPPMARWQRMALSTEAVLTISDGFRSSQAISTMRRPAPAHMRGWFESAAGIDEAPGKAKPRASAIAVIVAAVPMVMHTP